MFSVLALTAMIAAYGPAPADTPSASPAPLSTPYTTVTPAPLPGAIIPATPLPLPAPTPVPTPVLNVFDNVTLGDAPAAVKKSLGKPFEIDPVNVGEMWRYNADSGNARLSVIFGGSGAMSITLSTRNGKKSNFADPYGVVLGMTVDQLTSLRGQPVTVADNGNRAYGDLSGVRWVYGFDSGLITDINVSQQVGAPSAQAPSSIDTSLGHDGSTPELAIVIKAASSGAGTDLEYGYINGLRCALGGTWNVITQTTMALDAKWIDTFDVTCSTDKSTQKIYFDVTSYAGK